MCTTSATSARPAVELRVAGHDLADREVRVDAGLLQHDADSLPELGTAGFGIDAEHTRPSAVGTLIALEDLHSGRLARTVGPQHRDGLTLDDGEADAGPGANAVEGLLQVLDLDRRQRAPPWPDTVRPAQPIAPERVLPSRALSRDASSGPPCQGGTMLGRRPKKDQPGAWGNIRDAFLRTQERVVGGPRPIVRRRRWWGRRRR